MKNTTTLIESESVDMEKAWEAARQAILATRSAGRNYLLSQVMLGWQIFTLKNAYGSSGSGRRKESRQVGDFMTWSKRVQKELGIPDRTADRLISMYEAVRAKIQRLQAQKKLPGDQATTSLSLLAGSYFSLHTAGSPKDIEFVTDVVASLVDGETQMSLLGELGITPEPPKMPKGGLRGSGPGGDPEQIAFAFFNAHISPIFRMRATGDYKTMLGLLPVSTDDPKTPSIRLMLDEVNALRAELQATLDAKMKIVSKAR